MRFLKSHIVIFIIISVVISDNTSNVFGQGEDHNPSVIAHFHLSGTIIESSASEVSLFSSGPTQSLRSLVKLMEKASKDDQVKAVIFTFDTMSFELAQMEELRRSINQLKSAGKKVYMHSEEIDNFVYTLLCSGDDISMEPHSTLWLTGIYSESVFVKDLLGKVGINADYMQIGDFKAAAESLTRGWGQQDIARALG